MSEKIIGRGWSFPPRLNSQGILALTNAKNEIEEAIQIILMTSPGQRVMRPHFGCRIHDLVFAPNNLDTMMQARRYVEEALGMWEPRITVIDVEVERHPEKSGALLINIVYEVKSIHDKRSLVHPFYLIPEE